MVGRERAIDIVRCFDLQRGVADAETSLQFTAGFDQERITGIFPGHDKMRGQRDFGGAHRPDMEVVDRRNAAMPGAWVSAAALCGLIAALIVRVPQSGRTT